MKVSVSVMKTKKLEKMNGEELAEYWCVSAMTISRWLQRGVPVHDPVAMYKWSRFERRLAPGFQERLSELYSLGTAVDWKEEKRARAAEAVRRREAVREQARIAKLPKPPEPPTEQERRATWHKTKAEMLAINEKRKAGLATEHDVALADLRGLEACLRIRDPGFTAHVH